MVAIVVCRDITTARVTEQFQYTLTFIYELWYTLDMNDKGFPYKKGQIVKIDGRLYEVERDVEWSDDFGGYGSVWLVGEYPPRFTHKGGIELIAFEDESKARL